MAQTLTIRTLTFPTLRNAGLAAVTLLGSALLAGAAQAQGARPAAVPPAIQQLAGAWELIGQGGARKCRITLRNVEVKGGRAVGYPATCRRGLPILGRISAWTVSDDGLIRLTDASGQPVLSFSEDSEAFRLKASADGADYQIDSLGKPRRYVPRIANAPAAPRVAFDPAKAPPRESIPGTYTMIRYGGQEVCRVVLGTNPGAADGRFLTNFPTRCRDKGLQVFDAVAWRYTGGKVYLIARRGHEMTLVPTADGEWQKDPPGGSELTLRRLPN
jgi:hypothetical protein